VQRLPQHFALRATYGTALRSPNVKELGLNKETGAKNIPGITIPNLDPETFQSVDFAFLFNNAYVFAALNGFYNITANALDGVNTMNVNYFANQPGNTTAWGVELEARFRTPVKLEGFLNYSFALATDSQNRELTDVPSHKLNAGLLYSLLGQVRGVQTGLRTAVVMRWIKDYRAGVLGVDQRFPGNFLLDLNFIVPIGRSFDVNLQARNVLDGSYKIPKNGLAETPIARAELFGGVSLRL
jgi:outer membrane receptor protein involved in Fe transport